jgi:hypothetical protein
MTAARRLLGAPASCNDSHQGCSCGMMLTAPNVMTAPCLQLIVFSTQLEGLYSYLQCIQALVPVLLLLLLLLLLRMFFVLIPP